MKRPFSFPFIRLTALFLSFALLSCGRVSDIPDHLDDDFLHSAKEGLYRIRDLTMVLDEAAVKPRKGFKSKVLDEAMGRPGEGFKSNKQTPFDYETILSERESLYANNDLKPNVSSLKELLRIKTLKEGGKKVKISSSMENIFIHPEIPFLNEYELLDYEIPEPKELTPQQKLLKKLLGKIRNFKGFPGTDYYILPHFIGNYLVLYKLGPPDKIPYVELPLAKRIGGMLAVPFVGYPVEYCEAVKFLDSNLRETLKSRPLCKGIKPDKPVKYVRLQAHKKQVFKYLDKLDFFQRDFFDGQWFHVQTLVRSPSNRATEIEHTSFKQASLVEFRPSPGKMDVVEVYNLKQDDEKRVLFIPVKWTDYEIAKDSENLDSGFSERLKKDTHEINRPYVEIKFNDLIQNEFEYQEKGGKSLKFVVVTKDYISFDVEITTKGRTAYLMKYAFKRYAENPDYIEKQWFKRDSYLFFPMFQVKRKYYEDPTDHTLTDANRYKRVVRFDPKSREIKWRFSKQTSRIKWIRDLGYEAEKAVNKALRKAGVGSDYQIQMVLDRSGADKEIGDIRYNILNLVFSEGEAPEQFRLGKNVANPLTGEVISATANVWVNRILKEYISLVRRYIRFQVYPPAWKMKPFSKEMVTFIHENAETENLQCNDLSSELVGITPFLHEKISSVCEEVSDFIDEQKDEQKGEFHPKDSSLPDEEDEIINSCVRKLARMKILQSIVHSILHSFGLEDIESASVDSENFYKQNEIETLFGESVSEVKTKSHPGPPQYSSVMDYMDLEYPVLSMPGKLDIAALRFIYFDKVEKAKGGFLHVPSGADQNPENPQKSILQAADAEQYSKEDLKEYKICGWDRSHPLLCEEYDYGVSPLEAAANSICQFHNHLMSTRNRYEGEEVEIKNSRPDSAGSLYNKWAEYRDNILAGKGKTIMDYSLFNPNHLKEYEQIKQAAGSIPEITPYYLVREPIFDYFKRLVFAPVKRCVYKKKQDSDGTFYYSAVALEIIEKKILSQYPENSEKGDEVFMSCESQIVKDWAAGEDRELVTEVGFFIKDRRYFIRPNEKTDPIDEKAAFQNNLSTFFYMAREILYKEPDLGVEYYKEWLAYITEGTDLNPYIDRDKIKDFDTPKDMQFERVLSYEIDTMSMKNGPSDNLWLFRERGLKEYIEKLKKNYSNIENKRLLPFHFFYRSFSLADLRDYLNSATMHHGLHDSELPFLIQSYREYEDKQKQKDNNKSFEEFIQTHPAVFYNSKESLFLIPYADEEVNVPSRLFRQHNEFSKCIDEQEANIKVCDDIDSKIAFKKFMLDNYK